MKRCDYIVSNSILLKPQFREVLYSDLPKRIGKYSIDARIESVKSIDIFMLKNEKEKTILLDKYTIEAKKEFEKTNNPIFLDKIEEINNVATILEEIKKNGSSSMVKVETVNVKNNSLELTLKPLGDILVIILHLEDNDIVIDRNIKYENKTIKLDLGFKVPNGTSATVKYLANGVFDVIQ